MPAATAATRLLRSPMVDLLVGPHGIDRYLELIRPDLTVRDARAEVVAVQHPTPRAVTLKLRPNRAWSGFRAGQFIRVGVEIAGVRRTRTYSPASSPHSPDGLLELTVTAHTGGLVSGHLHSGVEPGTVVHLGEAQGSFVLPEPRPERLVLISGGSGVTPVMSILRTLCDEGHRGEVTFVHYARGAIDWLYRPEVQELAAAPPGVRVAYVATREGGEHISAAALRRLGCDLDGAHAAVCGPPALIEAVRSIWSDLPGGVDRVLAETFTPPALTVPIGAAQGRLRFLRDGRQASIVEGTLLEQAEAAGLSPKFGCRMGICHTCTCQKASGAVRNILTGRVSTEENETIQLCVSVPAGDVALEI
ncbi:MAG: ferredoxin reductase [Solirubrobacteraceae bacterium]